ncbi:MAG: hypothetical protein LAN83_10450 [Acidobacteriia bacterium]|nr:hypothetical protein [Terriglobia bacterium]
MAESAGTISTMKEFVTFLREGTIAVVLLLFLLLPGAMKNVMAKAGFASADIAGFKFELQQSAQQTQTATETVTQLEDKLSALKQQLDQVSQSAAAPEVKQKIMTLSDEVGKTRAETSSVQTSLRNSLATQRSIIQKVDPNLLEQKPPKP